MIKLSRSFAKVMFVLMTTSCAESESWSTESVDETKAVSPTGKVLIENTRGEIRVFGWEKGEIRVKGDLDDRTENFIFEVQDQITVIRVKIPKHTHSGDGSKLDIHIPVHSRLSFNGVSTDLDVNDVKGGSDLHTVSGEVHMKNTDGGVDINTVSGDVDLQGGKGEVRAVTVSGNIDLEYSAEEVTLQSVSGGIRAALAEFQGLKSETVSGSIEVSGYMLDSGDVVMESVSGDINLVLQEGVNARIQVTTGPGGDIINDLTSDQPEVSFPSQMRLRSTAGAGEGRIKIGTVTGDVSLSKKN